MCDFMQPIPECQYEQQGDDDDSQPTHHHMPEANFEQLVISMLEEREKLNHKLKVSEQCLQELKQQLNTVTDAHESLKQRVKEDFGDDRAELVHKLAAIQQTLNERSAEVEELKAERRNIRLLLEHLEYLVSMHERSLRMSVVKRQTQQNPVTSEVEVLKAFRSLFEHHKALDEKVREKMRGECEKNKALEKEIAQLRRQLGTCSNVSLDSPDSSSELNYEKGVSADNEQLSAINAELKSTKELCECYERELKDADEKRRELERRAAEFEDRYSQTQEDHRVMQDILAKLEMELSSRNSSLKLLEEKLTVAREKNELLEQRLSGQDDTNGPMLRSYNTDDDIEQRYSPQHNVFEEGDGDGNEESSVDGTGEMPSYRQLVREIEELTIQLKKGKQREAMKDDHNLRLSATLDKLMSESNERVESNLKERVDILEEKSRLAQECDDLKRKLDCSLDERDKMTDQINNLMNELENAHTKRYLQVSPRTIRQQRYLSSPSSAFFYQPRRESVFISTAHKDPDCWDQTSQASVVNNVRAAFESSDATNSGGEYGSITRFHRHNVPRNFADLPELAIYLQNQLDAVLSEMRSKADQLNQIKSRVAAGHRCYSSNTAATTTDCATHKFATLPSRLTNHCHFQPSTSNFIKCETSPPPAMSSVRSPPVQYTTDSAASPNTGNPRKSKSMVSSSGSSNTGGGIKTSLVRIFKGSGSLRSNQSPIKTTLVDANSPTTISKCTNCSIFTDQQKTSSPANWQSQSRNEFSKRLSKKQELLDKALNHCNPFSSWDTSTVVAWLELWVGMPAWYVAACRANVKSGAIMAGLSDSEIQREIGISNPLHRLKLRLAVIEIVDYTCPSGPRTCSNIQAFKEMNHEWVGNEWLPSLGLTQYRTHFMENLVDARMLSHLTKKDLRSFLKMVDNFHRTSLHFGISVLKKLNYNKAEIGRRRELIDDESYEMNGDDAILWTNEHVIRWVNSIGLSEYANNLLESGVHGGLIALDDNFTHKDLALRLQIPTSQLKARQILEREFKQLKTVGWQNNKWGAIDQSLDQSTSNSTKITNVD
ncbi:hypothetical protein ACOME3_002972 [Neoechinorhynchus agilis]